MSAVLDIPAGDLFAEQIGRSAVQALPPPPLPSVRNGVAPHDGPERLLAAFESLSLASLDSVSLLARTDTKYVLSEAQLTSVLPTLAADYWVLEIDGRRAHRYTTLYFDTPEFSFFRSHCAGKAVRHKVRSRAYVDTGLSYLEVKAKDNRRRTLKYRLRTEALVSHLYPSAISFVASHVPVPASSLEPKLWNDFRRMTLVGKRHAERLTVDIGLGFRAGPRSVYGFPGLAIAELKQGSVNRGSPFVRQMRNAHVQPASISKYCVGVSLLHGMEGRVKYNAFKPALRTLDKLVNRAGHRSQGSHVW